MGVSHRTLFLYLVTWTLDTRPHIMTSYELIAIFSGNRSETEILETKKAIQGVIATANGSITREEDLGKRRLAYPIRGEHFGTYAIVEFDAEPAAVKDLRARLARVEGLLRQGVLKKEIRSRAALERDERQRAAALARGGHAKTTVPSATPIAEVAPTGPVDVAALDKKLDELLEQPGM